MMGTTMNIVIEPEGTLRCIYTEDIELAALGCPTITRASHVEPDRQGRWQADLTPIGGPVLTGFAHRSEALAAEHAWLEAHWLTLCGHNEMVASDEPGYAWKCARCGHVYGNDNCP
jgi:hypothetical protein